MLKSYKDYPVIIKITKRKSTAISVENGSIVVRTNAYNKDINIVKLLDKHQKWLAKQMQKVDGFYLLGKSYTLVYQQANTNSYQIVEDQIFIYINDKNAGALVIDMIYIDYQELLKQRIKHCVDNFELTPSGIVIKRLKRAFGICHKSGKISFNLYLTKYSIAFIDMVIYHELCHLVEMNHSKRFYSLLENYVPDYKIIKKMGLKFL